MDASCGTYKLRCDETFLHRIKKRRPSSLEFTLLNSSLSTSTVKPLPACF